MTVALSEAPFADRASVNGRELHAITETARMFGCRVYPLPTDFNICGAADDALAYVPAFDTPQVGIWIGYIPSPERYTAVFNAASSRNIRLINTPDEYRTAMEFDRFYPLLNELTPKSRIVESSEQLAEASSELGFPIFIKGAIKSNKEQGWKACVAENISELTALAEGLFANENIARGRVILRKLARLRTIATDYQSFPLGREYRVFVYQNRVLTFGFYWDEYDDAMKPTAAEKKDIFALAVEAARRVGTPFIAVDIGQTQSGDWIVIEVGDGQFCGLSQAPLLELWGQLKNLSL